MVYTDSFFLFCFVIVALIANLLNPIPRIREWFIIAFSLLVIGSWGAFDLTLFLVVVILNFFLIDLIGSVQARVRHVLLTAIIVIDLSVLGVFKYASAMGPILTTLLAGQYERFPLGIPLAISFYTFHLISYAVDVFKGRTRRLNFREYLFYLSFFPHVIAGPIVRAWQMVPQIGRVRRIPNDRLFGLHYLFLGIFLKAILANNIALIIDPYWANGGADVNQGEHIVIALCYYCQIYADFAGYTLIALGMARLLGYRLPGNFRGPMLAINLQDFWRRWHITFSRWLRDYLYIPMGGSRVSKKKLYLNLLVTMVIGGIWHGAGWGFVVWGALHGIGLAFDRLLRPIERSLSGFVSAGYLTLSWLITQSWVLITWVFFRSDTVQKAWAFLSSGLGLSGLHSFSIRKDLVLGLCFALPVLLHNLTPLWIRRVPVRILAGLLGVLTPLFLLCDLIFHSPEKVFIYFRF